MLGIINDNKLSFDEHIDNFCKTAKKKVNAFSRINHYMKQRSYYCYPSESLISPIVLSLEFVASKNLPKR